MKRELGLERRGPPHVEIGVVEKVEGVPAHGGRERVGRPARQRRMGVSLAPVTVVHGIPGERLF